MSGAECVAVVGLVASVITVVETCHKIVRRIEDVKNNASLRSVSDRMKLFAANLETVRMLSGQESLNGSTESVLKHALHSAQELVTQIEEIIRFLTVSDTISIPRAAYHATQTTFRRRRLKVLLEELEKCRSDITFHLMCEISWRVNDLKVHQDISEHDQIAISNATVEPSNSKVPDLDVSCYRRKRRSARSPCQKGVCSCPCHEIQQDCRGWIITAQARFLRRCDCLTRDYILTISALERILKMALVVDWSKGLSIDWSLKYKNTVKRTSPGFLILEKCRLGFADFETAKQELMTLASRGQIDFADINRDGEGMMEALMHRSWSWRREDVQFDLLRLLTAVGAPIQDHTFLTQCLRRLRTDRFLDIISYLLACKPERIDTLSTVSSQWSKNHFSYDLDIFEDPFHLHAVYMITQQDSQFGDAGSLHNAIADNDLPTVKALLEQSPTSANTEKNFRGQHALHVAILNPEILAHLIKYVPQLDLDVKDMEGYTPLMYATVYGLQDIVIALLDAGADPFLRDDWSAFDMWDHAMMVIEVDAFGKLLGYYNFVAPPALYEKAVIQCLLHCISPARGSHLSSNHDAILSLLLKHDFARSFITEQGNSILHLVKSYDVHKLLTYEGYPLAQRNDHGYSILMVHARFKNPAQLRRIIEMGASAREVDNGGLTALHHLNKVLSLSGYCGIERTPWIDAMESIVVLTTSGTNMLQRDNCHCACSLGGCIALTCLLDHYGSEDSQATFSYVVPGLLEWYTILAKDHTTFQVSLAALYRRQRFDELGMIHTCCNRSRHVHSRFSRPYKWYYPEDDGVISTEFPRATDEDDLAELEEISEEETHLREQLDHDCSVFVTDSENSSEMIWMTIIARRIVMMEDIYHIRHMKPDYPSVFRGSEKGGFDERLRKIKAKRFEVLCENPLQYVDTDADYIRMDQSYGFVQDPIDLRLHLADNLRSYLEAIKQPSGYMKEMIGETGDIQTWVLRRESMVNGLVEEVERLRKLPAAEKYWDLE